MVTAYLTVTKFFGGTAACPTQGCDIVLSSPYAMVGNLPLTLFGCLAYLSMMGLAIAPLLVTGPDKRDLRTQLTDWTRPLLLIGGTAMMVFSGYLMYLLAFQIKVLCIYCLGSALMSLALFVLAVWGQDWPDLAQPVFVGFIAAFAVLLGTLGLYASINNPGLASGDKLGAPITTTSGPAEVALAQHLADTGAIFYGAWWCPHCHDQKQLFGQQATQVIPYEECSEADGQTQTDACQSAEVRSYPTWEINGERITGAVPLAELARLSGYTGPTNFQNSL